MYKLFCLKVYKILEVVSRWYFGFCKRCLFKDGFFFLEKWKRNCDNSILIVKFVRYFGENCGYFKNN